MPTITQKRPMVRNLTFCAVFAALTAICSQIAIPLPAVPINLALLAVYLCGALLGPLLGLTSQLVFLLIGAVGLPVFAGFRGGVGVLAGPTGGYLVGYLAAVVIVGLLTRGECSTLRLCGAMVLALAACYTLGTIWFVVLTGKTLVAALSLCVFPFLPGDAIKIAAAVFLVRRLRPHLAAIHR